MRSASVVWLCLNLLKACMSVISSSSNQERKLKLNSYVLIEHSGVTYQNAVLTF